MRRARSHAVVLPRARARARSAPPGRARAPRVRRRRRVPAERPPCRRRPGARPRPTRPARGRRASGDRAPVGSTPSSAAHGPRERAVGSRPQSGRDHRSGAGGGCRREHSACPPPSDRRPRRTPARPRRRVPAATRASTPAEARSPVERRVEEREPAGQVGLDRQLLLELVLEPHLLGVVALLLLARRDERPERAALVAVDRGSPGSRPRSGRPRASSCSPKPRAWSSELTRCTVVTRSSKSSSRTTSHWKPYVVRAPPDLGARVARGDAEQLVELAARPARTPPAESGLKTTAATPAERRPSSALRA